MALRDAPRGIRAGSLRRRDQVRERIYGAAGEVSFAPSPGVASYRIVRFA